MPHRAEAGDDRFPPTDLPASDDDPSPAGVAGRSSADVAPDGGERPDDAIDPDATTADGPTDGDAEPRGADVTGSDPAGDDPAGENADAVTVEEGPAGREVVVPMALYKRVTVVSTLAAMVSIVAGFGLLDRATDRASLPLSQVDPLLALAGLGLIAAGGVVYAFSTRFRAAGMGNPKSDEDPDTDDG